MRADKMQSENNKTNGRWNDNKARDNAMKAAQKNPYAHQATKKATTKFDRTDLLSGLASF